MVCEDDEDLVSQSLVNIPHVFVGGDPHYDPSRKECTFFYGSGRQCRRPFEEHVIIPVKEMVNHPAHYGGADNPLEHVKVAEALGWVNNAFIYNCTRYLWRYGKKDPAKVVEDLEKAKWYLEREIARLKK
jgi:hypothetical protein